MGVPSTPRPVKLIVAMLSGRADLLEEAAGRLEREYGPLDVVSEVMPFNFTHYYDQEMGAPLLRRLVAFERLIDPGRLGPIKRATNRVEEEFAAGGPSGPRTVNLDPGYVAEGKLVLASTKDFAHRVYLGEGVFAEVTLMFGRARWIPQVHTFPDYASGTYDGFLTAARNRLRAQLGRKERRT